MPHPEFRALLLMAIGVSILATTACNSGTDEDAYFDVRGELVDRHIMGRGIRDAAVLRAMRTVQRHEFVPPGMVIHAYEDRPLPIGAEQTISQPYVVALMTEALGLHSDEKVLEIGTGSGYQAAVLAEIVDEVYTIEIIRMLALRARKLLDGLGYTNIRYRVGNGYLGWPEQAPFDAIIVTAAPPEIPPVLQQQLKVGGRLILPVGVHSQELLLITRTRDGFTRKRLGAVRFVPMIDGNE